MAKAICDIIIEMTMQEESVKDKIQREDHDRLIKMAAVVDNIALDIKTLADGFGIRIGSNTARIIILERLNDELKPSEIAKLTREHDQALRDLKTSYKTLSFAFSVIGAVIGITISFVTNLFGLLK